MAVDKKKLICPMWIMICIIFFSQNTGMFNQKVTGYTAYIRDAVQLLLLAFLLVKIIKKDMLNQRLLIGYFILAGGMIFGMCIHRDTTGVYWILECSVAFFLISLYDKNSIAERFEKIVFVICCIYTTLWLIATLYKGIIVSPPAVLLENTKLIWHHTEMFQYYTTGIVPIRSYAIFREPGVYQMFIVTAMVIEIFVKERFRPYKILIYMLAIVATYSTTGYVCLAMLALMIILKYWKTKVQIFRCIVFGIGVTLPLIPRILEIIMEKFTAVGVNSHSWLSRFASVVTNIYMWKKSPLFGTGLSYIYENYEKINTEVFDLQAGTMGIMDDTNTVLLFLAAFGIIVGLTFTIGIFLICKQATHNNWMLTVILFVIMLVLFAGEALNSTCYPYVLFFIGISSGNFEKEVQKDKNVFNNYRLL